MCLIILLNKICAEFPLIIAANRDELPERKFSKPTALSKDVIGCRDHLKDGSWLATNKSALFAAITNQNHTDKTKKFSRGKVVLDAMNQCKSLEELLAFVEEFNPNGYNDFNLVFGNKDTVYIAHSYLLHSMVIRELPQGINIISSDMQFSGTDNKRALIHDIMSRYPDGKYSWLDIYKQLKSVLAISDYGVKKRQRKGKDGKLVGVATTSSTILAFDNNSLARYKFYDRSIKFKAGKGSHKYIDYIDLLKNPDGAETLYQDEEKNRKPEKFKVS